MSHWNTASAIKGKKKRLLEVLFESDGKTVAEICRKANIGITAYYKYIKDPKFAETIDRLTLDTCRARKPITLRALLNKAESGDVAAIRTQFEIDGTLKGKGASQVVNLGIQANEAPTANMDDMTDDEVIAMLDEEQAHIDAIRKGIEARRASARAPRLEGDGIIDDNPDRLGGEPDDMP